jgi:plastocyanin
MQMKLWIASAIVTLPLTFTVHAAGAAPRALATTAKAAPPPSDIARLEAEIKAQRDILLQSMQIEQQHYDLLLKLIQNVSQGSGGGVARAEPGDPGAGALVIPAMGAAATPAPEPPARKTPERTATVTGKVAGAGRGADEVYVYVQNVHGPAARGRSVEIAQKDKQFVPSVAVVQRGTKVTFPNFDAVYHNVFSPGPPHAFDLGSYRAGEAPRAIEMTSPGVVELFCNMHSKMHASVLVVPNALWTRVGADGSFRIDNVPVGARKLVAWSAKTKPADQTVEVGPGGASVNFTLGSEAERPHNNKYGMPYGSYKE